jgi:hypothetical protein
MAEFNCSVLLVHHTGVSDEAQHRARGSSAWRGALDIEISIVPGKDGGPIQIVQRKSKDAELAEPVWAELTSVTIPGWMDEDGQPVTSAVVSLTEAPVVAKKESKESVFFKTFADAWWASGSEEKDGSPYITRSALKAKLMESCNEATADKKLKPGYADQPVGALLAAGIISPFENGWVVSDGVYASVLLVRKNGDRAKS